MNQSTSKLCLAVLFTGCLTLGGNLLAEPGSAGGTRADRVSVLVHLAVGAERDAVLVAASELGGYCKYQYRVLPDVVNLRDVPRHALPALESIPGIVRVEEDRTFHTALNDSTPVIRGLRSQLAAAGLSATGQSVRVCVVDTGIDTNHTMYDARIDAAAGFDFVNGDADPEDDNGHGAHVAGIALGRTGFENDFGGGSGSEPVQGVAPEATLIGVKVLGPAGSGYASDVIAGIDHCADAALPGGPADVINLSLGGGLFERTCDGDSVAQAANNAVATGVVVVAAAGNNASDNGALTPACGSQVIAVGATYDDDFPNPDFPAITSFNFSVCSDPDPTLDAITCFSNRGILVDVAAPGCLTFSADYADPAGTAITDKCGTSMASPHVAGLAALILDLDPSLTPAGVRQIIRDGTADLGAPGFDTGYGFGRIDAISSLLLASACTFHGDCDDGLFCNGVEQCSANACAAGAPPCPSQPCDESGDACVPCASDTDCDDGLLCNGSEVCTGGSCTTGGDPCTGRLCDPATNTCADCIDDTDCDDGDVCTGIDFCDAGDCRLDLTDCNDNGIQDSCDIGSGMSLDVDPANGVPDECDARVRFLITEIPTLGGEDSQAYGINDLNQVVGAAETGELSPSGNPIEHAFLWDAGVLTDLGTLGGESSLAFEITNNGKIAGTADLVEPIFGLLKNQPCKWEGGQITQLAVGTNYAGLARAVNQSGAACGASANFESLHGHTWDPAGQPFPITNDFGGNQSDAWGINEVGDVVGWMTDSPLPLSRRAFMLKAGSKTSIDLGTLGGSWGWALDINDLDQVVGQAGTVTGSWTAFLWTQSAGMSDLGNLGGTWATARAINNASQVVGVSTHPGSVTITDGLAFLWESGVLEDLNDLAPGDSGWVLRDGWDINEAGRVVGWGINPDGFERGFLLIPCGDGSNPCFPNPCQNNSDCDDGLFCTGQETCVDLTCQAGTPVDCDDGIPCTVDSCHEGTDSCDNVPDDPACDNGLFCDGAETCDPLTGCQPGTDPCGGPPCDEAGDTCPGSCDDDLVCEAGEDCVSCPGDCFSNSGAVCGNSLCEAGDGEDCVSCPTDCNGKTGGKPSSRFCCGDGDGPNPRSCSDPLCNTEGWSCTNVPVPGSCCGDGTCEGTEDENNCAVDCASTCGSDPECDDGDPCTDDSCVAGTCTNTPIDCDDADACTADSCVGGACAHDPVDCNDGNVCTDDTCEPLSGCTYTNNSDFCDDGDACTEDDVCSGGSCGGTSIPGCGCGERNEPCVLDEDCCSGICKANGRCK